MRHAHLPARRLGKAFQLLLEKIGRGAITPAPITQEQE
jgi:hypothetical protein